MKTLTILLLFVALCAAVGCNNHSVTTANGVARVRIASSGQIVPVAMGTNVDNIYQVNDTLAITSTNGETWTISNRHIMKLDSVYYIPNQGDTLQTIISKAVLESPEVEGD